MNMNKILVKNAIFIAFIFSVITVLGQNNRQIINLQGKWNFAIGDNMEWSKPHFNDSNWEKIKVPARWEEEGYQGYNGFAWYRISVVVPEDFKNRIVYLELGYIDDVDEIYFNGEKIGQTGSFPPQFSTAYNAFRKYVVPNSLLKLNKENSIAVRTYDAQLEGGIVRGNVRLMAGELAIQPNIDLSGTWNFSLGLNPGKTAPIVVPGQWENQGYSNYDGFAVYSRTVEIAASLAKQKLIFLAGRIDDDDEFFINGKFIAGTGDINRRNNTNMHLEKRNYFIPDGIIKPGKNLFELKIIDRSGEGGILEGPVGIITQDNFIRYWQSKRQN